MFEIQSKIKRQVEILGLCLNKPAGSILTTFDFADRFGVEELTIKRDLSEMRNYGIDIHSQKKIGVCINSPVDPDKISECIVYYTGIINPATLSEKATSLLVHKRGENALKNMVLLQHAIENCLQVIIFYNKEGDKITKKIINPVLIYQNEGNWRLLVKECDKFKQFLVYKIDGVEVTRIKFPSIAEVEFENLFKYAWKSWVGNEKYNVRLQLSDYWAENVKARIFMDKQQLYKNETGCFIFETTVNSLNEITTWIISLGKGVKVLEPQELKENVISLAKESISNYELS